MKKSSNIVGLIIFMIAFAFNPIIGLFVGAWLLVKYTKQRSQGTEAGAASNSPVHSKEWIQPEDVKPKKKQQGVDPSIKVHTDNSYDVNKKADYHGVSKENRDNSYTTRELYEDIASRKTDYRSVNKDLL